MLYGGRGPAIELIPIRTLLILEDALPVGTGNHLKPLAGSVIQLVAIEGNNIALIGAGIDIFHPACRDNFIPELHLLTVGSRERNNRLTHACAS